MKPNIYVIYGRIGTGKTEFVRRWLGNRKNVHFVDFPKHFNEEMSVGDVFASNDAVVVDEILAFERISAKNAVSRLIAEAIEKNKILVLVVQMQDDLESIGVELPEGVAYATKACGTPVFEVKNANEGKFPDEVEFRFDVTVSSVTIANSIE